MKIEVEMLAIEDGKIRVVEIPDEEWAKAENEHQKLGLVFQYGQNEFQPRDMCSVSVGDVVLLDGKKYKVAGMGWVELNGRSYNKYLALSRNHRHYAFELNPDPKKYPMGTIRPAEKA